MLIAHGVSDQLDDMKMTYAGLPSMLTHVVERELEKIPRSLRRGIMEGQQMWSIIYMPQVQPVLLLACTWVPASCLGMTQCRISFYGRGWQ